MRTTSVDVLTIGAGGGAYPAAFMLASAGLTVVMVDPKGVMSGNCLAEGCVPSKAVREMAHHMNRSVRFREYGIEGGRGVDYARIVRHKDRVQEARYAQHQKELESMSNLRLLKGHARFLDAQTLSVDHGSGSERIRSRYVIVASGSDIFIPPIPGASLCLTSRDFFALNPAVVDIPESLAIVGGGYIGIETAAMYRVLGSAVTVFESAEEILGGMETVLVKELRSLLDPSIRILTDVSVDEIRKGDCGFEVRYRKKRWVEGTESAGESLTVQKVMMAVGRHPVIPEGAERLGVGIESRGIVVNPAMQTAVPHIFATGDVNGITPLFHAAVRQSIVAAHNILGGGRSCDQFDPSSVPTTIFSIPEAAYVGITEDHARKQGLSVLKGEYRYSEDSRAQILGEPGGGIRLLFESGSLRLIGGSVVGVDAGNLIGEIGLALSGGLTAYDLSRFADQHPMASEGIGKAARSLL
jgi:dihydrolipoamide dehydrogenase